MMELNVERWIDQVARHNKRCRECIGWAGVWTGESSDGLNASPPECPNCGWRPVIIRRSPIPPRPRVRRR